MIFEELPIEVLDIILRQLSMSQMRTMAITNKYLNLLSTRVLYSNVEIIEKYDSSRFKRTKKFLSTISISPYLAHGIRSLTIIWKYIPSKIDIGFDGVATAMGRALVYMLSLRYLNIKIRLKDKSFRECFPSSCKFKLLEFKCNFGRKEDKKKFFANHR